MIRDHARLEKLAQKLQDRGANDIDALVTLCEVYWKLGRQEASVATYRTLLGFQPPQHDAAFDAIYLAGLMATGTCPTPIRRRDRLMHLVELLRETSALEGDVVECGCFQGLSSYTMCSFLRHWNPRFDGRGYHIFDSFQGLSEPTVDDDIPDDWENADNLRLMTQPGNFAASLEQVQGNLREFPGIAYHPGWIPLSFEGLPDAKYRFIHVDVDLYDPTLDAFNYFYPRLVPGGVITSDDYSWPGARTAIDEFCAERGIALAVTATNQAVIRRPAAPRA